MDIKDALEPIEFPVSQKAKPGKSAPKLSPEHRHPKADHEVVYTRACEACVADDEARRGKGTIPAEDLYRTVFLVPNFEPELGVCQEFLRKAYKGRAVHVAHTFKWPALMALPNMQVVIVRRVPKEYDELTGAFKEVESQIPGKLKLVRTPVQELLPEVLESRPLQVGDFTQAAIFSLNGATEPNVTPLVIALQDLAGDSLRILLRNPPDVEIVCQSA